MKRIILITTVCACGLLPLQAQSVDEVLQSVAQHNKSIQAQQKNGEAEKIGIVCPIFGHEVPQLVRQFLEQATFETSYFYPPKVKLLCRTLPKRN